ncbi:hypothetical protein B0H19DRAFT_1273861 [Mycena capillaripes]|nr:hypothetical protein B0H19DRAFT_1273861 [Mycena capillaripes]
MAGEREHSVRGVRPEVDLLAYDAASLELRIEPVGQRGWRRAMSASELEWLQETSSGGASHQLRRSCQSSAKTKSLAVPGRILWIRRAATHIGLKSAFRNRYNTAIGIILESGALYCFAAILLVISFTLDVYMYPFVFGVGQQLINIIPMFTLVYIGLNNAVYNPLAEHIPQAPLRKQPVHQSVHTAVTQPA